MGCCVLSLCVKLGRGGNINNDEDRAVSDVRDYDLLTVVNTKL